MVPAIPGADIDPGKVGGRDCRSDSAQRLLMSKASALFPPFVLAEIQVDKLTKSWILPLAAPSYRFSQKNEAVPV